MAFDVKKIQSLSQEAINELQAIEKMGGLEHLKELNALLKQGVDSGELEQVNPMLPPYVQSIRKNLGFLTGNYASLQTHAKNRVFEIQQLNEQLSHIKR
ncbi:hypothetical protein LNP18_06000 [Leuconostoc citreum]|uniref:hypothetical protein n=1 Tax=Leuconostoc citreum TaxID=33964 RepID=UPI00200B1E7C|nr:hypothetical protein [Leuconostoc citreum]MCK8605654.1 hypothetical protein [Leuconostoc citreum]